MIDSGLADALTNALTNVMTAEITSTNGDTTTAGTPTTTGTSVAPMVPRRILVRELNDAITCKLCNGYFVDATTLADCMHSFCRSCIVRHLFTSTYCPICEIQLNKTPTLSLRTDKQLQLLTYKLVPALCSNEMRNRADFHAKLHSDTDDDDDEDKSRIMGGNENDATTLNLFLPDDCISLSLEYYRDGDDQVPELTYMPNQDRLEKRYLQCPAGVNVRHLVKFVRMKFGLSTDHRVDIIYMDEVLASHFTLMDVAYTFSWKRAEPMKFFYRIFAINTKVVTFKTKLPLPTDDYIKMKHDETRVKTDKTAPNPNQTEPKKKPKKAKYNKNDIGYRKRKRPKSKLARDLNKDTKRIKLDEYQFDSRKAEEIPKLKVKLSPPEVYETPHVPSDAQTLTAKERLLQMRQVRRKCEPNQTPQNGDVKKVRFNDDTNNNNNIPSIQKSGIVLSRVTDTPAEQMDTSMEIIQLNGGSNENLAGSKNFPLKQKFFRTLCLSAKNPETWTKPETATSLVTPTSSNGVSSATRTVTTNGSPVKSVTSPVKPVGVPPRISLNNFTSGSSSNTLTTNAGSLVIHSASNPVISINKTLSPIAQQRASPALVTGPLQPQRSPGKVTNQPRVAIAQQQQTPVLQIATSKPKVTQPAVTSQTLSFINKTNKVNMAIPLSKIQSFTKSITTTTSATTSIPTNGNAPSKASEQALDLSEKSTRTPTPPIQTDKPNVQMVAKVVTNKLNNSPNLNNLHLLSESAFEVERIRIHDLLLSAQNKNMTKTIAKKPANQPKDAAKVVEVKPNVVRKLPNNQILTPRVQNVGVATSSPTTSQTALVKPITAKFPVKPPMNSARITANLTDTVTISSLVSNTNALKSTIATVNSVSRNGPNVRVDPAAVAASTSKATLAKVMPPLQKLEAKIANFKRPDARPEKFVSLPAQSQTMRNIPNPSALLARHAAAAKHLASAGGQEDAAKTEHNDVEQ